MSINPTFSNTPVLAKVKIGNSTYFLKDAELRNIVSAFGNAVEQDIAVSIGSEATGIPLASDVFAFVVSEIGTLGQAITLLSESDHTEVLVPRNGNFVVESNGEEWLYVVDSTTGVGAWREVGSENAYVLKTFEVAGIAMSGSEITASQLSSAMDLKAFAHADSVSYTPEGGVSVSLSTSDVNVVTSVGKLGSFNAGSYVAPSISESSGSFATAGLVASVGSGDDAETLILTAATLGNALTATNFNAGSYTAPTYTGAELPSVASFSAAYGVANAAFSGTSATIAPGT